VRRRGVSQWLGPFWVAASIGMAGCAAAALMSVGAVAGYAISRDRVELTVERPYAAVWTACLEETKRFGRLQEIDERLGQIQALSQGTHVVITLERVTEASVKIVVKARRHLLPQIDVAQRLATRIARRVG